MATRSQIGILYSDGSIETVYCWCDGEIRYNGKFLYDSCKTMQDVKEIIKDGGFGDVDHLYKRINKIEGSTTPGLKLAVYPNLEAYKEAMKNEQIDFHYLFDKKEGKWNVCIGEQYVKLDLKRELEKQYLLNHHANIFCVIKVKDFKLKTGYDYFQDFLYDEERNYHNLLEEFIYSDYVSIKTNKDKHGDLVIYFEPLKYFENVDLDILQAFFEEYEFDYSISKFFNGKLIQLGTFDLSNEEITKVLSSNHAESKEFVKLTQETDSIQMGY